MKINWRVLAEIAAVLSVVISLAFVWYELRLSRSSAQGEYFSNNSERLHNIRVVISENSDLWRKGCLGEELSAEERISFNQITSMYERQMFMSFLGTSLNLSARTVDSVTREIARNMYLFPGFERSIEDLWEMRAVGLGDRPLGSQTWINRVKSELEFMRTTNDDQKGITVARCGI